MKNTFEQEVIAIGMLAVTRELLEKVKHVEGIKETEKRIKDCVLELVMNHPKEILKIIDEVNPVNTSTTHENTKDDRLYQK